MKGVVAIVQARMGSSRLPGKMLADIDGMPLVDHVLGRLMAMRGPGELFDEVVLATSTLPGNDPLADHVECRWPQVVIVRGSEVDVLSRFAEAVSQTGARVAVRVTGDCPLINTEAIGEMVSALDNAGADIVNYQPGQDYADKGIEVISGSAIRALQADPELTDFGREHVTSQLYRRPDRYKVCYIPSDPRVRRADCRLTIDTEADLRFFRALAAAMGTGCLAQASVYEVLEFLDAHRALGEINAGAGRKSNLHEPARVGFRCDGGPSLGMGHVVGCLRLARLLADSLGWGAEFVCREERSVRMLVQQEGFAIEQLDQDILPQDDIGRMLEKAVESDWSAVVVNFGKDDLERYTGQFSRFRQSGIRLVFMDNPLPPDCYEADLLLNALPHPDYEGYNPDRHDHCLDGLRYFLPGESLEPVSGRPVPYLGRKGRILVAMGGGDSSDLNRLVLEGIARTSFEGEVDLVVGIASGSSEELSGLMKTLGLRGSVSCGVTDMFERMSRADLGFTGFGLTTYEMAYAGLPALVVANSVFNAGVAEKYCRRYRAARLVGAWQHVSAGEVAHHLDRVLGGDTPWQGPYAGAGDEALRVGAGREEIVAEFKRIHRLDSREATEK